MSTVLTPYTAMIFFPGGNPAAGATIDVITEASNVLPQLFADSAGTVPIPSSITADGMGTIAFYAPPGYYLAELSGTMTRIGVDPLWPDPVFPNLYVHTQAAPAAVWTIDHYFGVQPQVELLSSGEKIEAHIMHPTVDQTVITFSQPESGLAQLRR